MMEILATLFTGVLSGGATGLLGILLQRWFDHKKQLADMELAKLQMEAARETRRMELEAQERMAAKAAETQALQAQLEAHTREIEAAERSYQVSHETDQARYLPTAGPSAGPVVRGLMALVDGIRGLMRPGITTYTLYLLTAVFLWVQSLYDRMGLHLTPEEVRGLAKECIFTILYLSTACVIWWFGVRPAQPPARR